MTTLAMQARAKVYQAIQKGALVRPDVCELCGVNAPEHNRLAEFWEQTRIVAHHWRGYLSPLDIWWICVSCNKKLRGKHDGKLSKDQARHFVTTHPYLADTAT